MRAARDPTGETMPLPLRLYRLASLLAAPLVPLLLRRRLAKGKEDPERLGERLGRPALARPAGTLVWLHAASVGETVSILPLIARIAAAGHRVLLTSGTVTSARLASERLPPGAIHQFVPADLPDAVAAFLDHWRPDAALFCESEIWPNLMLATHARGVPCGIVNGRMSDNSFRAWSHLPDTSRALLGPLRFCLAQGDEDARRFATLGAPAKTAGNLKFDAEPPPADEAARDALARVIGRRPVLVTASTHPGEETIIAAAAGILRATIPDLLTIIVPRHPARGAEIAAGVTPGEAPPPMRSRSEMPRTDHAFYIADTLGELGLFYALATLAFIGGTLVPVGGHNPIEAAKSGVPILHGPHVAKARDIYRAFDEAGAAVRVADTETFAREAARLLADPAARDRLAVHARALVTANEGALERTCTAVLALLLPAETPR